MRLQGKVALITGAAHGMGETEAKMFAKEGAKVVVADVDDTEGQQVVAGIAEVGGEALFVRLDVTQEADWRQAVDGTVATFGRLDILVNNAGAVRRSNFFETSDAEWQDGFALKFFAHVKLARLLWPKLRASGGSVIAISGIGARAPVPDYMIGASVIGASLAFMKALAELGKRDGVQVNTVNPGSVDTDRFRHRLSRIMAKTGLEQEAAIEHHRRELDITRFGTVEDVAGLVRFVVSPRGRWIHGSALDIDGGQVGPLRMSVYD